MDQPATPSLEAPAAADGTPSVRPAAAPVVLRRLAPTDPLRWLAAGWRDFVRCPAIGLFYGGCFMVMGWALLAVYEHAPAWVLALSAGFLLVGPFLCLGLYRASQRLEAGARPDFGDSLLAWDTRTGQLAIFGFVLLVLEMLWGRATLVIMAVSFDGMPDFKGSLLALLDPANLGFTLVWVAVGAVFAGLIYAISAVSMPMILHRETDAVTAALTSMRLVLSQPGVMLGWAALIVAIVGIALLPAFAGLLVAGPVVGHASWHAYRAAVADPPPTAAVPAPAAEA
jgi:uncharacterized membrane protein